MKLSFSKRHSTPSETADQVIDIDVTPIMNMLVVLIPILVSMAVFSHYSVHRFYLPSNAGNSSQQQKDEKVKLKTTLLVSNDYLLIAVGGDQVDSIPREKAAYDTMRLKESLFRGRKMSDDSAKVVISVRDEVLFENTVELMDLCREVGFENIGLSSAPAPDTTATAEEAGE